ncbi:hypothetical protein AAU57_08680 [Nonlabens sp. YIK11]|uniref:protein-export chaperone SecB n=1 Tax=Nonlabens sp. YIK11 TaxID=1453349 RepID=UPI0006DCB8F1|nr:protein-export chaperone SecB [Nonlabens sp. YIK11]KQC33378.1 hypothetical protein AAU57_08680 [Nonlabens sp. YIK11]
MNKDVAFKFESYQFDKVSINFQNLSSENLNINFKPSGIFKKDESEFALSIIFTADTEENEQFIEVHSVAVFKFKNASSLDDIPSFFYRNAIAIFFPYLRAFVSLVSNQANHPAFLLPTLNLSDLEVPLKENTTIV